MRPGTGKCNGTFGELVQGVIGERPFLITLPIPALRSEAIYIPNKNSNYIIGLDSKIKAIAACKKLCQKFKLAGGGHLHIRTNIPAGKGMASSSADIVAAMRAMANSYSLPLTEDILSSIAAEIEPSDGVMYEEVIAYDYIHGELIEVCGSLPPHIIVCFDMGGAVDTIQFNRRKKPYNSEDKIKILEAYELIREGIRKRDLTYICKAATISAHINQKILPIPYFHEIVQIAAVYNGGLVIAHSGTVFGILLAKNELPSKKVFSEISRDISAVVKNPYLNTFYFCT